MVRIMLKKIRHAHPASPRKNPQKALFSKLTTLNNASNYYVSLDSGYTDWDPRICQL